MKKIMVILFIGMLTGGIIGLNMKINSIKSQLNNYFSQTTYEREGKVLIDAHVCIMKPFKMSAEDWQSILRTRPRFQIK